MKYHKLVHNRQKTLYKYPGIFYLIDKLTKLLNKSYKGASLLKQYFLSGDGFLKILVWDTKVLKKQFLNTAIFVSRFVTSLVLRFIYFGCDVTILEHERFE